MQEINEILISLGDIIEFLPVKQKNLLLNIIENLKILKDEINTTELLKIEEELESLSNVSCVDSFSRNEILNVISLIETMY